MKVQTAVGDGRGTTEWARACTSQGVTVTVCLRLRRVNVETCAPSRVCHET